MPVDEFGREIPAAGGVPGGDSDDVNAADGGTGVHPKTADGPSRLYEALPTSRYDDDEKIKDRNRDGPAGGVGGSTNRRKSSDGDDSDGGRGGGGSRRKRKHRDDGDDDDDYPSSYSRGGRRGGGGGGSSSRDRHDRYRDRDDRDYRNDGGDDYDDRDRDRDRRHHHHDDHRPSSSSGQRRDGPHPSTLYTEESMLCQVLWKEEHPTDIEGKTDEEAVSLYDQYRLKYGLNYVRCFFNQHMDDSWFRARYSPLARYQQEQQEIARAQQESSSFQSELAASIEKNNLLSSSAASSKTSDPCFFVLKARLGGGIRHLSGTGSGGGHGYSNAMVNPVPASHVLKVSSEVLPVRDVPPHVTDEQLTAALMSHATTTMDGVDAKSIVLHSGPPRINEGLMRTCYLQAPEAVRKEIIQQLHQLDRGIDAPAVNNNEKSGSHVPRKDETHLPKVLELEVECSDPYGRLEVDADGKGGEPEDTDGVTPRKASVWVSTRPLSTKVQVLSAALSTKKRIESDLDAARKLATAYDVKYRIPTPSRLESLLVMAVPNVGEDPSAMSPQDMEDALDITVAYLRRVHLFSFYNGCSKATTVAEVLNGDHAASTVHLRLSNADEILEPAGQDGENGDGSAGEDVPVVDLLVQRLNTSIEKALAETNEWDLSGNGTSIPVVDPKTDSDAKTLKEEEKQVEPNWIADHTVMEEGRARCSFHFCRKLFKDISFLKKHLLKKHPEFLRAEIAKCHDPYMMKAWDEEEQRPVPPVLVDCGHRFGLVPSPILGDAEPMANDPEPALWERLEEERKYEEELAEEQRQRKERQRLYRERQQPEENIPEPSLDAPLASARGTKRPEFVDVDDMQVEKVEMTFDDVEIPILKPEEKKKKKKRKLL